MPTDRPKATLPTVDLARGLLGRGELPAAAALLDEAIAVAQRCELRGPRVDGTHADPLHRLLARVGEPLDVDDQP